MTSGCTKLNHEIKHDGYRMTASLIRGRARLWTRNGYDWTERFPTLAVSLEALGVDRAAFDGELVCLDEDGKTDFAGLQSSIFGGKAQPFLYLFDLVHLEGIDLYRVPLVARKAILRRLLEVQADPAGYLRYSDHIVGDGPRVFDHACRHGLEGIVSKRSNSRYRPGRRSRDWMKIKNPNYHREIVGSWVKRARVH